MRSPEGGRMGPGKKIAIVATAVSALVGAPACRTGTEGNGTNTNNTSSSSCFTVDTRPVLGEDGRTVVGRTPAPPMTVCEKN